MSNNGTEGAVRLCGMLGFAMRAGKVVIGSEQVFASLQKRGRVKLVLVCRDASDETKKHIRTKSEFYSTPVIEIEMDMQRLGALLGKTYAPACVALTDDGFAREISKLYVSEC